MKDFTVDWVSCWAGEWRRTLRRFVGENVHAIEIGSHEGRSACWFMDNVLTHPDSTLTCIDPHGKVDGGFDENYPPVHARFMANTEKWRPDRLIYYRRMSKRGIPLLSLNHYSFAYIDGFHTARAVLSDAVGVWERLVVGGIMIFDDYLWVNSHCPPEDREILSPRLGIDSFLNVYAMELTVISVNYQVIVQKIRSQG